ncbi:hypothetical protein [Asaia astilbis]|uniref:hypothetical protein n=1 Tax=Asaia astilbis TaxID=610244 RepID=UPI0012EBA3C8|nr:hypothetical protein [Asaia astilbis]
MTVMIMGSRDRFSLKLLGAAATSLSLLVEPSESVADSRKDWRPLAPQARSLSGLIRLLTLSPRHVHQQSLPSVPIRLRRRVMA